MRVLVCGGREYDDWRTFKKEMDWYIRGYEPIIIHGDAKGADFLARVYSIYYNLEEERYPADWKKYGRGAGSIRNQQMIDEGKPDLVIAFPGGNGTADMIRRANKSEINVIEIGK